VYRRLDPDRIVATARLLSQRVSERFPGSGLSEVAAELTTVSERAARDAEWFARPHRWLRALVGVAIGLLLFVVGGTLVVLLRLPTQAGLADVLQAIDAVVNETVFIGIAIFFLGTLESRLKRRRALKAMHELRSMAHIIDLHQLTKDPERILEPAAGPDTPSSPKRDLDAFGLSRYLDYSSEMLSLLSKSAALYVQNFDDPATIIAVNEVESLTTGLSGKIWQKIMIVDRDRSGADA